MSVLSLHDLTVREGPFEVVHAISLELSTGDVVALVGPNGSGKAALLRGIVGLAASHGKIMLDDVDLGELPAHRRVRHGISLCPLDRALFLDMSVRENVLMGAFPRAARHGVGQEHGVEQDVELLRRRLPRLAERWTVNAGQLSGGEQRLLGIAKALMARPKFLLLNEPTAGLAPGFRSAVTELVRSGLTSPPPGVLLADQDLDLMIGMASRLLVFRHGRIVEETAPPQSAAQPRLRRRLEELV
ncbi:MAG: ATP-binding cassette domain-containing protein [bacterium]|nr:ATP-binding cassette domain-containing protein [bacterium]